VYGYQTSSIRRTCPPFQSLSSIRQALPIGLKISGILILLLSALCHVLNRNMKICWQPPLWATEFILSKLSKCNLLLQLLKICEFFFCILGHNSHGQRRAGGPGVRTPPPQCRPVVLVETMQIQWLCHIGAGSVVHPDPWNFWTPTQKGNWLCYNISAESFYIMKLCSRHFVLYCWNCPKEVKFRYFIPILRKLGAA